MHHNLALTVLLLPMALPLAAQDLAAGTAAFHVTMAAPAAAAAVLPPGSTIDMEMKMMTDGHNIAVDMVTSAAASPIGALHLRLIFTIGTDTVHMGIFLPPEAAAAMGGGSGMRMDMPISMMGAGNPMLGGLMDSIGKVAVNTPPVYRSLGTSATVAGITCQEWEAVAMGDTIRTCVIPTPPALLSMQERFSTLTGMKGMMAQIPGMSTLVDNAYGGQKMTAIRTSTVKSAMQMELVSFTAGAPDAAMFQLPADMRVMPMPAMPGGGGQQ